MTPELIITPYISTIEDVLAPFVDLGDDRADSYDDNEKQYHFKDRHRLMSGFFFNEAFIQIAALFAFSLHLQPRINHAARRGIAPGSVELYEAVVAVNDVKRPSQFGQERDWWSPFRSERQARPAGQEVACRL